MVCSVRVGREARIFHREKSTASVICRMRISFILCNDGSEKRVKRSQNPIADPKTGCDKK